MPVTRYEPPDPEERAWRTRESFGGGMRHRASDDQLMAHVNGVVGYDVIEKRSEDLVDSDDALSREEIWQELNRLANERLGISAAEFVVKWRAGDLDPASGTEARLAVLARLVEH